MKIHKIDRDGLQTGSNNEKKNARIARNPRNTVKKFAVIPSRPPANARKTDRLLAISLSTRGALVAFLPDQNTEKDGALVFAGWFTLRPFMAGAKRRGRR